jgi:hypothetical protein
MANVVKMLCARWLLLVALSIFHAPAFAAQEADAAKATSGSVDPAS